MLDRGVLIAVASFAVYAWSDALIKALGHSISVYEIGVSYSVVALIPLLMAKPKDERLRDILRFRHRRLMPLILLLRVVSAVSVTYTFATIPLTEAYCIVFLIPVLITVISVFALREEVHIERWLLILASFAGVLLVVRPGFRSLQPGHVAAIICACADATAATLTRFVSRDERRSSLLIAPMLCSITFYTIALLLTGFKLPTTTELIMMIACGLTCGVGYILYVTALATSPASRVAPMLYSQIVWALILGAAFFNEVPDGLAIAGLVVIVTAGIGSAIADGARARIVAYGSRRRAEVEAGAIASRPPEF